MKKNFLIITLILLVCLFYGSSVKAMNVVRKIDNKVYVLSTTPEYNSCDAEGKTNPYFANMIGVLNDSKLFFYDYTENKGYVKDLTDDKYSCEAITNQETVEAFKKVKYRQNFYTLKNDGTVTSKFYNYFADAFVKTEDVEIDNLKDYYESSEGTFAEVSIPISENLDNYYEKKMFKFPTNINEIDDEVDYYQCSNSLCEKIQTPAINDVMSYMIITTEGDALKETDVLKIDTSKFETEIMETYKGTNVGFYVSKIGNDYILRFQNNETDRIESYKTDGTLYDYEKYLAGDTVAVLNQNLFSSSNGVMLFSGRSNKYSNMELKKLLLNSDGKVICEFKIAAGTGPADEDCPLFMDTINFSTNVSENVAFYGYYGLNTDDGLRVTVYDLKSGSNQKFNEKDLTFTFSGELSKLSKILLNDKELESKYYTTKSGSTIITISKDYLAGLKSGNYTLKVEYSDGGYASADFSIPEANPKTIDSVVAYFIITIISIVGIISVFAYKKRYN